MKTGSHSAHRHGAPRTGWAGNYSGRPGLLGFLKLLRSITAHIAITGGMAVGDSLIQQFVGHGIAARLSARLGEGVLNGLLTARVGLSAMAVCRPMPFGNGKAPKVADVAPFLFSKPESKGPATRSTSPRDHVDPEGGSGGPAPLPVGHDGRDPAGPDKSAPLMEICR